MKEQDLLYRFVFDDIGIRGEWVKLGDSLQAAKKYQPAADHLQQLLGQALAAVVMLSATVKFNGSMILQAQGDGKVKTLVAQSTNDKKIRGLLRCDEPVPNGTLQAMFGEGRLVITIESEDAEPYQGITALEGEYLAKAVENYFDQSEQLKTRLWLFASQTYAAGLLLQELPAQGNCPDAWERIEMLANTISASELLNLDCRDMLNRLFHQEQIRLFEPEYIEYKCTCSRQKIDGTLRALGKSEMDDILKSRNVIEVDCEFCRESYHYDKVDIENLFSQKIKAQQSHTQH